MKLPHRLVQIADQLETVCALTASPLSVATTRPTCRVEMPRKNASRISSASSGARR